MARGRALSGCKKREKGQSLPAIKGDEENRGYPVLYIMRCTMQKFVSDRSNWTRNIIHPRHSLLSHRRLCSDSPCQEPELVLLVFYGVARLTQDKIGLWYDHETHLFLYIVCTLSFSLFLTPASPPCITYVRLDPSTC